MKLLLASILLCVSASASAADMILPLRGITDGDTIRTNLKLPCPLCTASVRVIGIDTPETNYLAKCTKEKALGFRAKESLIELAAGKTEFMARNVKWDKYGGRILASAEIGGVDVATHLINQGLAVPYTGSGPKHDWCN